MDTPTPEEQRELVRRQAETYAELEKIRRAALRDKPYDWEEVDALLALGDNYDGPPRFASGLVEMQRIFMKARPKP